MVVYEETCRVGVLWTSRLNFYHMWMCGAELSDAGIFSFFMFLKYISYVSFFFFPKWSMLFITVAINFVIELVECKKNS